MGLFFKKKKKEVEIDRFVSGKFESVDSSDDAFLVNAVSNGGITDDMFETPDEVLDKTRGYGSNSGLAYVNKYSATNQKLATTKVVDVGAFKKTVKEEPKPQSMNPTPPMASLDEKGKEDDVLLEPIKEDSEEDSADDSDFDSFFEEFMKKTSEREKNANAKVEEAPKVESPKIEKPKAIPKPAVKRKKKRAIDIDIISGSSGGDII